MGNVGQTGQSVYIRFITREQDEASHSLVDVFTRSVPKLDRRIPYEKSRDFGTIQ